MALTASELKDKEAALAERERLLQERENRIATESPNAHLYKARILERDPLYHYTPIGKSEAGASDSPIHSYMTRESPTRPGYPMYEFVTDDPFLTGDNRVVLIRCLKADEKAAMTEADARHRSQIAIVPPKTFDPTLGRADVVDVRLERKWVDDGSPMNHLA